MSQTKRIIVKLDDKHFEMKETKDGKLVGKLLSDDEVFEASVLEESIEKMLENDVHKLTNEAYSELQKAFKQSIKATVLGVLGFRLSYNGWEVDNCNARQSDITSYLSTKVKTLFHSEVDPLIETMMPVMMKDVEKTIRKEFKDNYLRFVGQQARQAALDAAKVFVDQMLTQEIQKHQKKAIEEVQIAFLGVKRPVDPDADLDE